MAKTDDLTGKDFTYWHVLKKVSESGAAKWLCRCKCGTERVVLARSLKSGISKSCGCLNRERTSALGHNLLGKTFGNLIVIGKEPHKSGSCLRWKCRCLLCGGECVVTGTRLEKGFKTHCGCLTKKDHTKKDISGLTFGKLMALYETADRDHNGSVIWHCRCECGNEVDVSYSDLRYNARSSCGCLRDEAARKLSEYRTNIADTSIDIIRSKRLSKNNTTGVTGVYVYRGKYRASITFQRKVYYLGTYDKLETAAQVRRQAEKILHDDFVKFYDKWKKKADCDPKWAEENPISITVTQESDDRFIVKMTPPME